MKFSREFLGETLSCGYCLPSSLLNSLENFIISGRQVEEKYGSSTRYIPCAYKGLNAVKWKWKIILKSFFVID